jgi:hypothetical protein
MSAIGTKRTSAWRCTYPLLTQSGHRPSLNGPHLNSYDAHVRSLGAPMRRREFITLISGAAAWPLAARAQQSAIPIVGFLRPTRVEDAGSLFAAFRQGLRESGYPSDKVAIESRFGDGRPERLPKLAAELVALQVAAIAGSIDAARAAKTATTSIPIFS